jgi:nucleolar protein 56
LAVNKTTCGVAKFSSKMSELYLLFESASGYGLFQNVEAEEIGSELDQVQKSVLDISK